MRSVSDAFLSTLRGSHTMVVRCQVLTSFQTGTQPTGGTEVDVMGGQVVADATADVRATLDLTTDGTGMWPRYVDSLLAPYGNEIFVERGIDFGNGTVEYCSLGYFRIEAPSQDAPPDGPIRVVGKDRMQAVIDARLLAPIQFGAATTYGDVVSQLITKVYPAATIEWDDATDTSTLDRSLITDEARFEFIDDLVRSVGKIWYWDHRGILVITTQPDPSAPVWDVNAGAGGVLVSASRALSREGVYNAVVALGESVSADAVPVRAVAVDANPTSPTYYYGRFGPVPRFYSSPFITSTAQAEAAAASLLTAQLGLPYSVDFAAVPNPALEPFDPVRIKYGGNAATEVHVLESVTVPLTEQDPVTATTREQSTILIGQI